MDVKPYVALDSTGRIHHILPSNPPPTVVQSR
jgi:hypothetical protein